MTRPPIALSIEDEGIDAEVVSWIEVLLNGVVQPDVVAFDCRAGTLTRPLRNILGELLLAGGEYRMETVTGLVEARWREGTPPA